MRGARSRRTVYVETSIPSFYFDARTALQIQARREVTRQWWAIAANRYRMVSSDFVRAELLRAPEPKASAALELIAGLEFLPLPPRIDTLIQAFVDERIMPADAAGDAAHLAMACHHGIDFLVTWNCRHLANANKFGHIRTICRRLRLPMPELITPLELMNQASE